MPRGSALTSYEKGRVDELKSAGKSVRQIASDLGRSKTLVANYLQSPATYGTDKRCGRPPTLKNRDKRRIVRLASNNTMSSAQIATHLDDKVGARRIRQHLATLKL